ncbi:HD domain-containing protein [Candidatus Lokiarchaeum ossiferum]|uniref:HD domain-containing protein n=1 Tax=Candidatus Lokiarchaeum ossiferum TaxID=2951803 RepID=UPI00352DC100
MDNITNDSEKLPSREETIRIMNHFGLSHNIINHELAVMRKARDIAHNITKISVDIELIKIGAIMHDIGRCKTHGMQHGPVGGDIIRSLGLSEKLARIAERHSMAGITPQEAEMFDLPDRCLMPESIEEKIVCLADKYHTGTIKVTIEQRFQRWIDKFGENEFLLTQIKRAKELEEEILALIF